MLKLTPKEIEALQEKYALKEPADESVWYEQQVADAATAKAAWGIVDWLQDGGTGELGVTAPKLGYALADRLTSQGIERPE